MNEKIIPNMQVCCKLGSIVIHIQEALSNKAHNFDIAVLKDLIEDEEVKAWLKEMDKMALLPKKR